MSERVEPALSPEEWNARNGYGRRQPRVARPGFGLTETRGGFFIDASATRGVEFEKDADFRRDRHALAALALHGQPFGFRWNDVDSLRLAAEEWRAMNDMGHYWADHLADRIAALLPPRDT